MRYMRLLTLYINKAHEVAESILADFAKPAALYPHRWSSGARLALAFVVAETGTAAAADAALVEAGRQLSLAICAKCHALGVGQPPPVLRPPAPTFAEIAARPDIDEAWLRAFLGHPHGSERVTSTMPPFLLTASQADAAVAYLMSLKPQ